ncbi:hypothetical protein V6N11_060473 [Hibiscus sabdariffa]|uniref:GH16 domain-containing protein n=1 Tax=Hibiscus sabdariffa TaxID=183260 RepID=A0ABR2QQF0_9ROSI
MAAPALVFSLALVTVVVVGDTRPPTQAATTIAHRVGAKIKLPSDYTAKIVVAFYTSNRDVFEKRREESYGLWFDPSKEFHTYIILWTTNNVVINGRHRNAENPLLKETNCGSLLQKLQKFGMKLVKVMKRGTRRFCR